MADAVEIELPDSGDKREKLNPGGAGEVEDATVVSTKTGAVMQPPSKDDAPRNCCAKLMDRVGYLNLLLICIPIATGLRFGKANGIAQFIFSALAIVPLAGLMGDATEAVAEHVGPGVGALLNAAFGNATEIILGLFGIFRNLDTIVKASLVGSIIGNILLVLGAAIVAGGVKFSILNFSDIAAGQSASMAVCAAIAILIPAIFDSIDRDPAKEHKLSLAISIVLMLTYIASLAFQLLTHRDEFERRAAAALEYKRAQPLANPITPTPHPQRQGSRHSVSGSAPELERPRTVLLGKAGASMVRAEEEQEEPMSLRKALLILLLTTLLVSWLSEILTGAVEEVVKKAHVPETFVGVVVIAIVGNAAEHSTAVIMATKDKMDVAIGIAFGSALQIAMFAMPLLVFCSYARKTPMDLLVSEFEIVAVVVSVALAWIVVNDGRTYWLEGVMLLMVYLCLAIGFWFIPNVE